MTEGWAWFAQKCNLHAESNKAIPETRLIQILDTIWWHSRGQWVSAEESYKTQINIYVYQDI